MELNINDKINIKIKDKINVQCFRIELFQERVRSEEEKLGALNELQKYIKEYKKISSSKKFYIWANDMNIDLNKYQYDILDELQI